MYVKPETISTPHHVLVLASVGHTMDVCTKDALHDGIDQTNIQGVFLTGTPPKNSKYKKVNLGRRFT